ncbi:MAG: hypothetical protein K1X65_17505 [Caldilineales bacterium]|nr:hypothetical protein [Caldilineales bacterium]
MRSSFNIWRHVLPPLAAVLLVIGQRSPAVQALPLAPDSSIFTQVIYLPFVAAPAPPSTSEQLIKAALARGEIDEETALVYRVFAVFGDERLPAPYWGDDRQVEDSDILQDVGERFASLPAPAQATLRPFILRPPTPGSWLEPATALPSPLPTVPQVTWGTVNSVNGKVKVWYQQRYAGDASKAGDIALALDAIIWPDLIDDLKMKAPLSDQGYPDNGGDGRLDIYLAHISNRGVTHPIDGCKQTPAYILINSDRPIGDATHEGIVQTVVHELMHASQFAYPAQKACSEYDWLAEATSKWAEDYVYPLANSEQPYLPPFLQSLDLPLEDDTDIRRPYGAYLWPFYLTHKHSKDLIPAIWTQVAHADSLEAIQRSIPGGFEQQWPEFTRLNWNRPPVTDYQTWDHVTRHVEGRGVQIIDVALQGAGDKRQELDLGEGVEHLAATYFHLKFPDPDVRTVAFYNGYTFDLTEQQVELEDVGPVGSTLVASPLPEAARKDAHLWALIKTKGHDWQTVDWTDAGDTPGIVRFCRDAPGEAIEELVLIFSNSQYQDRTAASRKKPAHLAPTLWASSLGCWQWTGQVTGRQPLDGNAVLTLSAQVTWERVDSISWPLTANVAGEWFTHDDYAPAGSLGWQFSGVDAGGCTWSGEGNIALNADNAYFSTGNYLLSGPAQRMYEGYGETSPLEVIGQRRCPDGTGGPYGFRTWWFPAFPYKEGQPGFLPFHASLDGQIDDATDLDTGWGVIHAEWQLHPQAEP